MRSQTKTVGDPSCRLLTGSAKACGSAKYIDFSKSFQTSLSRVELTQKSEIEDDFRRLPLNTACVSTLCCRDRDKLHEASDTTGNPPVMSSIVHSYHILVKNYFHLFL